MSYNKKHAKRKALRIKPKKPIHKKKWFWALFLLSALFLSVLYFIFFYQGFNAKNILIYGNKKIKDKDIKSLIDSNIETTVLNFWGVAFKTKNIFFINSGKITKKILSDFPVAENASVNKIPPQTIEIEIIERIPVGAYCRNNDIAEDCFLIDKNGVIFEELLEKTNGVAVIKKIPAQENIEIGSVLIDANITKAISDIKNALEDNLKIGLKEVNIVNPERLNVKTGENFEIYFNLSMEANINAQLTKLNLLLNNTIKPDEMASLEYIDLRFQDRIFYK